MYGNDPLKDLDLSKAEVREGVSILPPGRHACYVSKAEIKTTPKSRTFNVLLMAADGSGQITARLSLWSSNDQAREIAASQLKSMLTYGGHPNPDKPFLAGIDPMIAMPVGVTVAMGKPYKDEKGVERQNSEVKGFYQLEASEQMAIRGVAIKAKKTQPSLSQMASGMAVENDDEIPF